MYIYTIAASHGMKSVRPLHLLKSWLDQSITTNPPDPAHQLRMSLLFLRTLPIQNPNRTQQHARKTTLSSLVYINPCSQRAPGYQCRWHSRTKICRWKHMKLPRRRIRRAKGYIFCKYHAVSIRRRYNSSPLKVLWQPTDIESENPWRWCSKPFSSSLV